MPTGEPIFHVIGSMAHLERCCIAERNREGLEAEKERYRTGERPSVLAPDQKAEVNGKRDEESRPL